MQCSTARTEISAIRVIFWFRAREGFPFPGVRSIYFFSVGFFEGGRGWLMNTRQISTTLVFSRPPYDL